MLNEILAEIFERDLGKLKAEVESYKDDADLWKTAGEIANPAGNLCLHLAGNLRYFFGTILADSGYIRDRDLEFSATNLTRAEILTEVDAARADVRTTLSELSNEQMQSIYPEQVFGYPMTTGFFLTHLATHFNYHLGQINYHRRLVSANRPA